MNYDYGNWFLVFFNIVLFLYFIKAAFRPRTKTDWTTYRTFGAFIVALFAEMYGFPLTIYLLTSYFGSNFLGLDFTHNSGHLLNDFLGIKGDPHFTLIHILSNVFVVGGLILLSSAWNVLYQASRKNILATTGAYRYMRHPQYFAFILVIVGFLLQWPTLVTLLMAPILIVRYVMLAKSEEKQMINKFGQVYREYRNITPGFSIFLQGFIIGILALSVFYILFLFAISGDLNHPLSQFSLLQPWMSILIIGFGIQFGLFWLLRKGYRFSIHDKHDAVVTTGTSTTVSGMAMVACCAHHAVELLPILGLSAAALFLSAYQEQLLIFGVVTNAIGIVMMLWFITSK